MCTEGEEREHFSSALHLQLTLVFIKLAASVPWCLYFLFTAK
jgi:hypothetical protein